MNAMTTMAGQLQARPVQTPAVARGGKADTMRAVLRAGGEHTARELAEAAGVQDSSLVSALLKHDVRSGQVERIEGRYVWNSGYTAPEPTRARRPAKVRDVLDWEEIADDSFPDADITVLVRIRGNEEPVWLGYWDGEEWRDTDGQPIDVVRWVDLPKGGEV